MESTSSKSNSVSSDQETISAPSSQEKQEEQKHSLFQKKTPAVVTFDSIPEIISIAPTIRTNDDDDDRSAWESDRLKSESKKNRQKMIDRVKKSSASIRPSSSHHSKTTLLRNKSF